MAHLLFDQSKKIWGCVAAFVLFILAATASVSLGQISIPFSTVVDAFVHFDPAITEHMLVRTTRLTRAIIAMVIGGALAVAGAYMQALTRNPLASPSIFGINAGAMFFIVLALSIFPAASMKESTAFSNSSLDCGASCNDIGGGIAEKQKDCQLGKNHSSFLSG